MDIEESLIKIRKILEASDLTIVDSDGSTCFDWIEEEIDEIMEEVREVLNYEFLRE